MTPAEKETLARRGHELLRELRSLRKEWAELGTEYNRIGLKTDKRSRERAEAIVREQKRLTEAMETLRRKIEKIARKLKRGR